MNMLKNPFQILMKMKNNIIIAIVGLGQIGIYLYINNLILKKVLKLNLEKILTLLRYRQKTEIRKDVYKINNKIFFTNPIKNF